MPQVLREILVYYNICLFFCYRRYSLNAETLECSNNTIKNVWDQEARWSYTLGLQTELLISVLTCEMTWVPVPDGIVVHISGAVTFRLYRSGLDNLDKLLACVQPLLIVWPLMFIAASNKVDVLPDLSNCSGE